MAGCIRDARDPALRKARICYDHLAGEMCVRLFERMMTDHWFQGDLIVTERGGRKLTEIGLLLDALPPSNRPLCRASLDWSRAAPISPDVWAGPYWTAS